MSLILGVKKGAKFFLNSVVLEILDTDEDKKHIYIGVEGKQFLLNDREFVEILPTVFAAVGKSKHDNTIMGEPTLPRLAIDAPRSVRILRERDYKHGSYH